MKKFLLLFIVIFILTHHYIGARPWWWAGFSKANKAYTSYSPFEKWHAYFLNSANSTDTVYITSYTWDNISSNGIATIDGLSSSNDDVGINYLKNNGHTGYIAVLGDQSDADWLGNVVPALSAGIISNDDGSSGWPISHNKICYVSSFGFITSSANHTSGGWNYQHNNSVLLFKQEFPTLMDKISQELYWQSIGNFHNVSSAGAVYYTSPYGDVVEYRFSPGDNDGTTTGGIVGRIKDLLTAATSSIYYVACGWSDAANSAGDVLRDAIIANSNAFKLGCLTIDEIGILESLQNDHTCRGESGWDPIHSKVFIIDQEIVVTGSANFTSSAMRYNDSSGNDESSLIIHDFRLARKFISHLHHAFSDLDADDTNGVDAYETTPPGPVTNLTVTPDFGSFTLSWNKPTTNISDFSRYYIFIDSHPINSNFDLGDLVDDDGDGYYDEDPIGNIDRFASGSSGAGSDNDDDADGSIDEDPWLFPEQQIKDINDTDIVLSTYYVGDTLEAGVDYYFAVVAVDTLGNESIADTAGPFQLLSDGLQVSIKSNIANQNVYAGDTGLTVMSLSVSSNNAPDTIDKFTVENIGNMDNTVIDKMTLWFDADGNSSLDSTDTEIGELTWNAVDSVWDTTSAVISLISGGANIIVSIDLSSSASAGDTFQGKITIGSCHAVLADTGPYLDRINSGILSVLPTERTVEINNPIVSGQTYYTNQDTLVISGTTTGSATTDSVALYFTSGVLSASTVPVITSTWTCTSNLVLNSNNYIEPVLTFISGASVAYISGASITVVQDNIAPSKITSFQITNKTSTTVTLTWDAAAYPGDTASPWAEYRIYYKTSAGVTISDNLWASVNDINLMDSNTVTTIVTGLLDGVEYYFNILGVDTAGNVGFLSDNEPNTTTISMKQVFIDSPVDNSTIYYTNLSNLNFSGTSFRTDIGDSVGVYNQNGTQLGGDSVSIQSDSSWSLVNGALLPNSLNTITAYLDGAETGYSITVVHDDVVPTQIIDLSIIQMTYEAAVLKWTPTVDTGSAFGGYTIYYSTAGPIDTTTANIWDYNDDAELLSISTDTTIVSGLTPGTQYYFLIVSSDVAGNTGTISNTVSDTTYLGEPDIDIVLPVYTNNFECTNVNPILLSGTTQNSFNNDTVSVFINGTEIDTLLISGNVWTTSNLELVTNDTNIIDVYYLSSSASITILHDSMPPDTPILSESSNETTSITFSWTESKDSNFVEYIIYYDNNSFTDTNSADSQWTKTDDINLTDYTTITTKITGLEFYTSYYFQIIAIDTLGQVSKSEVISCTTASFPLAYFEIDAPDWWYVNANFPCTITAYDTTGAAYTVKEDFFDSVTLIAETGNVIPSASNLFNAGILNQNFMMDQVGESIIVTVSTAGNGGAVGGVKTDLLISQIMEANGNNKYVEIFNGTGSDVDLSNYDVVIYRNEDTWIDVEIDLPAIILPNNQPFVLINSAEALEVIENCPSDSYIVSSLLLTFNGDDPVVLRKGASGSEVNIDVVGVIGSDTVFNRLTDLQRKTSVVSPTINFDENEWNDTGADANTYVDTSDVGIYYSVGGYGTFVISIRNLCSVKIVYPDTLTHDTYIQEIYVSGTTENTSIGDTIEIFVNDTLNTTIILGADTSQWSGTVLLTNWNDSVSAYLYDQIYGQIIYDTITVNYYDSPIIEIVYPDYVSHDTMISEILISGTSYLSSVGETITLYVNNYGTVHSTDILTSDSGSWSGTVLVSGIYDSVVVELTDQWNRKFYDTITVNYFEAPIILFDSPVYSMDTYTTTISNLDFSGTSLMTKSGDTIIITFSGASGIYWSDTINLTQINDTWSGSNTLESGANVIVAQLIDDFGRIAWDTIWVNYATLGIIINVPDAEYDTYSEYMTIYGSFTQVQLGDSVGLYVNGILQGDSFAVTDTENWSGSITLTSIGDTVFAVLENAFGQTEEDSVIINLLKIYNEGDILITEIMYQGDEWVEIYNATSDSINLFHMQLTDAYDTHIFENFELGPNKYFVAGYSSASFIDDVYGDDAGVLEFANSGDTVIVYDAFTNLLNEIKYGAGWPGGATPGASIERRSDTLGFNNITNVSNYPFAWALGPNSTSLGAIGGVNGTPGQRNVNMGWEQVKINEVYFQDLDNPFVAGTINRDEYIELYNSGSDSVLIREWRLWDSASSRMTPDLPAVLFPPKCYLIVHLTAATQDLDFSDSIGHVSMGLTADKLGLTDEVSLHCAGLPLISYGVTTYDTLSLIDYVAWSTTGSAFSWIYDPKVSLARDAGQWPTASTNVTITSMDGLNIYRSVDGLDNNLITDWTELNAAEIWNYSEGFSNTSQTGALPNVTNIDIDWSPSNVTGDSCLLGDSFRIVVSAPDPDVNQVNSVNIKLYTNLDTIGIIVSCHELSPNGGGVYYAYPKARVVSIDADEVIAARENDICTAVSLNGTQSDTILIGQIRQVFGVVINEFLAQPSVGSEWVELYNMNDVAIDLSGCYIGDNVGLQQIPGGTTIDAYGFLVINIDPANFELNQTGDVIKLINSDGLEIIDMYIYGSQTTDNSEGRMEDGYAYWQEFDGVNDPGITQNSTNNPYPIIYMVAVTCDSNTVYYIDPLDTSQPVINISDTVWFNNTHDTYTIDVNVYTYYSYDDSICSGSDIFNDGIILSSSPDSPYLIQYTIEPNSDSQNLSIYVSDFFEKGDSLTLHFEPKIPPLVEIFYPDTSVHDTFINEILISGTSLNTDSGNFGFIMVNGISNSSFILTAVDGNWSGTAYVSSMYDSVTVEIIDNVSLHAYDTIMVNYMDTPIIEIIYPDYVSHDTTYANIIVSGTTYNTSAGDTVEIYLNGILQSDSMQLSDLSGTWSLSLDLLGLGDSATVKLTDQFGRIAWDTILINYFSNVPPYCTMISLVSGETYGLNVSCTFVIYDTNNENCTLTAVQYSVDSGMTWIDASIDSGNWTNIYADTDGETYVFIWMSYTDLPDTIIYPVQFRIIPFDNIDTGLADTIINFCIDNLQPDTPTGLIAIADVDIPDTGVILSWTEVIDSNLQGYNIYIDTGNGYTKINTSIVTDTEYFDSILAVQGDTQYYVVTAVDIYGNESGYSDSAGASHFVLYKELYSVMIGSDSKNVIPGATLEYRIYYLNNGFAPCDSMILYDTFPSVNTDLIDSGIISGFVPLIEFSNDNQSTWSYVPILVPVDVNITDLRFRFIQSIPPQLTGWSGVLYYKTVVK